MTPLFILTTSATAAEQVGPITALHLILIAATALATILVVWTAARIRARKAHERIEADAASKRISAANAIIPDAAPPPPDDSPAVADVPATADPAQTTTDDLTRLKGVGPKLAAQLAALGHPSYASLAALSPATADALDARLGAFSGRLARDRVVEQAGYLARGDIAGFEAVFGKL